MKRLVLAVFAITLTSAHAGYNFVGKATTLLSKNIANQQSHINAEEGRIYREIYPYFMDGCAAGQKVHLDGNRGSALGHGLIFIKGACIDTKADFPQVTTDCAPGQDEIGVSANGQFTNINWLAMPDEEMFFNGAVPAGTVLDAEYRKAFALKMAETGLFKNIKARNTSTKAHLEADTVADYLDLVINESITLDVALTWGRQTVCQRVPMNRNQIQKVVDYLNKTNQHYYTHGNEYTWDMFRNSCGHLAHNAFAAAGIFKEKLVEQNGLKIPRNISIPSNFFYSVSKETSIDEFPSPRDIQRNPERLKLLMEDGIIANQAGSLSRYHPVYGVDQPELNQLYNATESRTGVVSIPFSNTGRRLEDLFTEKKNYDLQTNLENYVSIYQEALEDARKLEVRLNKRSSNHRTNGHTYKEVVTKYVEVVGEQLALTQERLQKVKELSQD